MCIHYGFSLVGNNLNNTLSTPIYIYRTPKSYIASREAILASREAILASREVNIVYISLPGGYFKIASLKIASREAILGG